MSRVRRVVGEVDREGHPHARQRADERVGVARLAAVETVTWLIATPRPKLSVSTRIDWITSTTLSKVRPFPCTRRSARGDPASAARARLATRSRRRSGRAAARAAPSRKTHAGSPPATRRTAPLARRAERRHRHHLDLMPSCVRSTYFSVAPGASAAAPSVSASGAPAQSAHGCAASAGACWSSRAHGGERAVAVVVAVQRAAASRRRGRAVRTRRRQTRRPSARAGAAAHRPGQRRGWCSEASAEGAQRARRACRGWFVVGGVFAALRASRARRSTRRG